MKLFMAMNDLDPRFCEMALVAFRSAIHNTSLDPYLIFDGRPSKFTDELNEIGVKIIPHRLSFADAIEAKWPAGWCTEGFIAGTYLRYDIPQILETFGITDQYILYTDIDVIFMEDFDLSPLKPSHFACSTEMKQDDWSLFNAGVMLMNVPVIGLVAELMKQDAVLHFEEDRRVSCDQVALNRFFKGRWDRLPIEYNWKPYWGYNPEAKIVHFHGPKPFHVEEFKGLTSRDDIRKDRSMSGMMTDWKMRIMDLYMHDPEAYEKYVKQWESYR